MVIYLIEKHRPPTNVKIHLFIKKRTPTNVNIHQFIKNTFKKIKDILLHAPNLGHNFLFLQNM